MQQKPAKTEAEKIALAKRFLEARGYVVLKDAPAQRQSDWITTEQAAALLGISERTFHTMRKDSAWMPLPVQVGARSIRWSAQELEQAMRTNAKRGNFDVPEWLHRAQEP